MKRALQYEIILILLAGIGFAFDMNQVPLLTFSSLTGRFFVCNIFSCTGNPTKSRNVRGGIASDKYD